MLSLGAKNHLGVNVLALLCKLDHFNVENHFPIALKWSSLVIE
jgi:hypothetical protein